MTSYDSIGHRPPSLPLFFSFIFYSNESNKKQKGVGKPRIEGGIYGICIYVYTYMVVVCMHSRGGRDDLLSGEETNIRFPRRGNERRAKMAA